MSCAQAWVTVISLSPTSGHSRWPLGGGASPLAPPVRSSRVGRPIHLKPTITFIPLWKDFKIPTNYWSYFSILYLSKLANTGCRVVNQQWRHGQMSNMRSDKNRTPRRVTFRVSLIELFCKEIQARGIHVGVSHYNFNTWRIVMKHGSNVSSGHRMLVIANTTTVPTPTVVPTDVILCDSQYSQICKCHFRTQKKEAPHGSGV